MRLRGSLALVTMLVLAGCADQPRITITNNQELSTPQYEAVLDGGKVTPIEGAIVVKFAPFAPNHFETITRVTIADSRESESWSERLAGTTAARASGEQVMVAYRLDEVETTGHNDDDPPPIKGTAMTFLLGPFGGVKDVSISIPGLATGSPKLVQLEKETQARMNREIVLPPEGFRQNQKLQLSYREASPSGDASDVATVMVTAIGRGQYRGRPVLVFRVTGAVMVKASSIEVRGYIFLDAKTGVSSHGDIVSSFELSSPTKKARATLHLIGDVRF
jgi:hypothetical protein